MTDEIVYTCKNYRPNEHSLQMPGACIPHPGQIIADLYDPNGVFYRSAVVADVGASGLRCAKAYCKTQNDRVAAQA